MANLRAWDPFSDISRVQDELSRWFSADGRRMGFTPAVDIYEDKEAIYVKAEVPGVKADDVHINVENNVLTIRGERRLENEDKQNGYHRIERAYGSFTRSFAVPSTVTTENVDAEIKDGVLTLKLPKRAEAQPRRIQVKSRSES
jgi:HSP20 family protein